MAKYKAFGTTLQHLVTATWTDIGGILDKSGPGYTAEPIDVTTHDSTDGFKEYVGGVRDAGEISFDIVWDPEDTGGQKKLLDQLIAGTVDTYRIVFPSTTSKTYEFSALVTAFESNMPVEGLLGASVTMKISGKPTADPA